MGQGEVAVNSVAMAASRLLDRAIRVVLILIPLAWILHLRVGPLDLSARTSGAVLWVLFPLLAARSVLAS